LLATTGDGQLNDPGNRTSTRTALGYDSNRDQLTILQGGDYTTGFTLDDVQNLYRAVGVDRAIALDGGSSSALVVAPGTGAHWAGHGIDPTNPVRPVPGWPGLTLS